MDVSVERIVPSSGYCSPGRLEMKAVVLSETSVSSYCSPSRNTSEDLNPYHWCQFHLADACFVPDLITRVGS